MKALLLGSSFSAIPIHNVLKAMGYSVTVVGSYEDDACHKIATESIFVDYGDEKLISEIWESGDFDFIVPSCNDTSYEIATLLAARFSLSGFDSIETFEKISKKHLFRDVCNSLGLNAPKVIEHFRSEDLVKDSVQFEGIALIKPIDAFSGRGVSIANKIASKKNIQNALASSPSGQAILEEFVEGSLHSHTAFIENGRIVWHDFVDEFCEVYPFQVNRSSYPTRLSPEIKKSVNNQIQVLVQELELSDGLLHTQFISNDLDFWLIEAMRRCPGDLYGHHFELTKNFKYLLNYVAPFIGKEFNLNGKDFIGHIERQVISSSENLIYYGIEISASAQKTLFIPLSSAGSRLEQAPFDKAGIFFSWSDEVRSETQYTILKADSF